MELADVPRHRPLAFDKMESLIKEMQDPETGVPVRSQKLFLTVIPSAFMGYDLVEWLMDRFNLDEANNVEAINLANQLCQYGYFFPVNDLKNLVLKDDSSLYRFQSPYYWPWQPPRVAGGSSAPTLGPDNVEYAIYLVKRTLRNKQRHGLEDYEQEALANLKKNLAAKWDFITMQAEEQVRLAKERKKGDKIVSDSQERAYWRVARPPPGSVSALEQCPVPVRARPQRTKMRSIHQVTREIEHLKASLDRTRVKTSIALEALVAYSETFAPYDPWLTPPQPSNPWVSDDTLFWQINSPLVEVPSEKRVQRWALSMEELVSDPTGLQEFTSFLRKEYSHENIRFWLAVVDLRRSSTKQIPKKLQDIYEEFLKPGAPCEINIDGATAERVTEGIRSGSRYALDHAADHVYGLLLKKDCYPRFIRSDHFQRLLTEGRNVHQKKAKFFNFGGQVKKKPVGAGGSAGLGRRRGSDRSLSGSAHELAISAAQPPRAPDPPSHSHSQSNLADIPFRDPLDDDTADVLPWECSSREGGSSGHRRRQDSAADSGSSSSDVSAAVGAGERRRLPQQSTLDGGLRGAPPPLRRLSAVEPRHLAPLASPPERPRPAPAPAPAPAAVPLVHAPHPTPTISVSSAPDDESAGSPTCTGSPEEPRSLAHSEEPSSVFASADATPTEPGRHLPDERHASAESVRPPPLDAVPTKASVESYDESSTSAAVSDSRDSDRTKSIEDDVITVRRTLTREASISREVAQISNVDSCSTVDESIVDSFSREPTATSSRIEERPTSSKAEPPRLPTIATKSANPSQKSKIPILVQQTNTAKLVPEQSETVLTSFTKPSVPAAAMSEVVNTDVDSSVVSKVHSPEVLSSNTSAIRNVSLGDVKAHPTVVPESSPAVLETSPGVVSDTSPALALDNQKSVLSENRFTEVSGPSAAVLLDIGQTSIEQTAPDEEPLCRSDKMQLTVSATELTILDIKPTAVSELRPNVIAEATSFEIPETKSSIVPKTKSNEVPESGPSVSETRPPVAPLAVCEDVGGVDDDNVDKVPLAPIQRVSEDSRTSSDGTIAHGDGPKSVSDTDIVKRDSKSGERKRNDICPWEDENSCESDAPFVKTYATLGYL